MNKITTTLLGVCLGSFLLAQENGIKLQGAKVNCLSTRTNLPLQITFDQSTHLQDSQFNEWSSKELTKSNDLSLHLLRSERDELGFKHDRYLQYYKGYQIEGSTIIAHSKNNEVQSCNGDWYHNISPLNSISLTEKQALHYALNKINAERYKWENEEEEKVMKEIFNDPNFSYAPKGELILLPIVNELNKTATYQYAYKFNIYAEVPLSRTMVFVDAASGKIVREDNLIMHADAVGSANTKYSGQKQITTDSYTSGYRLRESGRGNGIETYNMKNGSNYGAAVDFTNTVNNWTVTTIDQAATDAHFGTESTYDYFKNIHNRNSIDNNGYKLLSYVHAYLPGISSQMTNNVNAFWDGYKMTYGDGQLSAGYDIMTALDVCGHEVTHGLVSKTAGLNGGEATALNEGFADIFGTCIEWYARPTQHDWLIGADIMTNHAGLRNTANPNANTGPEGHEPDTYHGTYWNTGGESHNNSCPCSYWFYLLSVGGSGTNDINNAFNVQGITMDKAAKIAFRALTVYMTPNTNYSAVRGYAIQAATDLYGNCSNEVVQTTNAWYAVGVGAQYSGSTSAPTITLTPANPTICSGSSTILTASGANTYTWNTGSNTASISVSPSSTTVYTVTGSNGACVSSPKTTTITVTTAPVVTLTPANTTICSGNSTTLTANGASTYTWNTGSNAASISVSPSSTTVYTVTGSNGSCQSVPKTTTITVTAAPVVTLTSANTDICSGSSTTLTASGANTYTWSTGSNATSISVSPGSTTVYTVTGSNAACQSAPKTTTINVTAVPVVTLTSANTNICSGSSTTLTASGANTYTWNTGSNATSISVSPNSTTVYTVTGSNANCVGLPKTTTITVTAVPVVTLTSANTDICSGNSTTLTASGANTYTWNTGSNATSISVSPNSTTVYTVTGSNANCVSLPKTTTITVTAVPVVTLTSANTTICSGNSTTLTASGANTYTWNTGSNATSISVSPNSTTVYTVTGSNGTCEGSPKTTTITVTATPVLTLTSVNATICSGSSTTLTASGANTYTWNTGSNATSISVSPGTTTVYTVTGSNGTCEGAPKTTTITVAATPTLVASTTNTLICIGESAVLTADGNASSYSWVPSSDLSSPTGSVVSASSTVTTTYTITATLGSCTAMSTITQSVSTCTGINELSNNAINLFPNPAADQLYITVSNEFLQNVKTIELYDALGKKLKTTNLNSEQTTIHVSELAKGIYFCSFVSNDGKRTVKRFVKE